MFPWQQLEPRGLCPSSVCSHGNVIKDYKLKRNPQRSRREGCRVIGLKCYSLREKFWQISGDGSRFYLRRSFISKIFILRDLSFSLKIYILLFLFSKTVFIDVGKRRRRRKNQSFAKSSEWKEEQKRNPSFLISISGVIWQDEMIIIWENLLISNLCETQSL